MAPFGGAEEGKREAAGCLAAAPCKRLGQCGQQNGVAGLWCTSASDIYQTFLYGKINFEREVERYFYPSNNEFLFSSTESHIFKSSKANTYLEKAIEHLLGRHPSAKHPRTQCDATWPLD